MIFGSHTASQDTALKKLLHNNLAGHACTLVGLAVVAVGACEGFVMRSLVLL